MKKILVVEDNEQNVYLISFILTNGGYEVITATTGEEGVELAIKEKPDLIVMDMGLTGIDGMEATKRIRESEADGKVPIIATTSHVMPGEKETILSHGCTGYIEKPINPDTFLSEIEKHL